MPNTRIEAVLQGIGDGAQLEQLAFDLLERDCYDVDPTGTRGPDNQRDALLSRNGEQGILHCSVSQDLENKLWERDGPDDAPTSVDELERVHVEVKTDAADSGEVMQMYARRRWHIREDLETGRELCLMPFGFSPMNEDADESVVLASADGYVWYEVFRTDSRETLLTNVIGPLSMDASGDPAEDPRLLVSDSNQGEGYQVDARLPPFWELDDADELRKLQD